MISRTADCQRLGNSDIRSSRHFIYTRLLSFLGWMRCCQSAVSKVWLSIQAVGDDLRAGSSSLTSEDDSSPLLYHTKLSPLCWSCWLILGWKDVVPPTHTRCWSDIMSGSRVWGWTMWRTFLFSCMKIVPDVSFQRCHISYQNVERERQSAPSSGAPEQRQDRYMRSCDKWLLLNLSTGC